VQGLQLGLQLVRLRFQLPDTALRLRQLLLELLNDVFVMALRASHRLIALHHPVGG
jgi:hypothetical protein